MAALIDTNVIIDVVNQDPAWAGWSSAQLLQHSGECVINPLIYTELCCYAASSREVDRLVSAFGFDYLELSREALFLAAQAFRVYKLRGGTRTAPLPDFFIGAHAQAEGLSLITRDKARYQTYFPSVVLIAP